MIGGRNPADEFILRLQHVAMWLGWHARADSPQGLTDPDARTGERWDWGQVWAHLAEFVPYWMGEVRKLLAGDGGEPVPFGRVSSDEARVAAIERDRRVPPRDLWERMKDQLLGLWTMLEEIRSEDWGRLGVHQTLGVMDIPGIVDEFLVGHLEAHRAQLDGLHAPGE